MKIIYQGIDITNKVTPTGAVITDRAGGMADTIELSFQDPESWNKWKPAKNDTIRITEDGFDSGVMFLDEPIAQTNNFILRARSTPLSIKTERTRTWRNVRLMKVAQDIAAILQLKLKVYGIEDYYYENVDQIQETDLAFLSRICMREGYAVKISGDSMIIYNEALREADPATVTISSQEYYEFKENANACSGCKVQFLNNSGQLIQYQFNDPSVYGGIIKFNMYLANNAEAQRFAKGYLRNANKYKITGVVQTSLNPGLAAASVVNVSNVGMYSGRYIIDRVDHMLTKKHSVIYLRKPLEGY